MKVSNIYTATLEELMTGTRRIVHQGGSSSGKTVNILGALAHLCSEETDGKVTTVTSMSFPHLKGGALRDFEMFVYPSFKAGIVKYHKTDHLFTFKSGSMLEFKVFEDEMSARGQKRKRLFINEANSFNYLVYYQLDSRSEQSVLDYNPSARFWAHEKVIGTPGTKFFRSWHHHNPFLTEEKHREIESTCIFHYDENGVIKRNADGSPVVLSGDYELWKVYARGLTGNVSGVIFPDWEMINDADMPTDEEWIFSVDYGFTNDPTALVKQCRIGNTIYVKLLAYVSGLPTKEIAKIAVENGYNYNTPFYSEHEPDMIAQLRGLGIRALLARKGQGSINAGIELLKTYKVKYSSSSVALKNELNKYVWIPDKLTGEKTNIPIDKYNHAIDAVRYGTYSHFMKYERGRG